MKKSLVWWAVGLWICFGWLFSAYGADRGSIYPGETKTGHLNSPGFADTWTFSGEAGDRVVITTGMISGYVDPEIYLYPPDSGPVEVSSTGVSNDHRVSHQLLQSGVYTIVIKDYGSDEEGDYGIALAKIPGPCTSLIDPDGGAIAVASTMTGTLSNHADTDMYQFYGTVGDRVVITTGMISGYVDPEIYLYPPDSGPSEVSSTGVSNDHRVNHQLLQSGLYTILIEDYNSDEDGDYSIALAKIPGPCTSSTDPDGGCPITSGANMTGTLSGRADTDMYQFYGAIGDRVVIITGMISGYIDPEIYLYPPDSGPSEDSSTGVSNEHSIDHQLLQSGLYTILIEDYNSDEEGGYGMSLTKIPATIRPGVYNPSPANGVSINTLSGSFSWDAVSGATGYDLYFEENVITPLQQIGTNLTSPTRAFPTMQWNKVYYWHVVAHTATGDIQGPYWWFKTEPTPAAYLLWTK